VFRGGRHFGWVYSPLRAHDLFGVIFADTPLDDIAVEVFDEQQSEDRLLYRSAAPGGANYRSVRRLELAGRT